MRALVGAVPASAGIALAGCGSADTGSAEPAAAECASAVHDDLRGLRVTDLEVREVRDPA